MKVDVGADDSGLLQGCEYAVHGIDCCPLRGYP